MPDEVCAAVAQERCDDETKSLHREEEQQAPRADRHQDAVDEARPLAVQPTDRKDRRESVADLMHDLRMYS